MEYRRKNPLFSACGLNCGLCPRYHTQGTSKCPGCAGEGFSAKHPSCGILSCSRRHGMEACCLCVEYPCKRYEGADLADSFITHRNQLKDLHQAKKIGLDAYGAELNQKVAVLENLLENFDDGRRKSFFCVAVNLLELGDVQEVMKGLADETKPEDSPKEKAAAAVRRLEALAEKRRVSLQLRKRSKVNKQLTIKDPFQS